MKPTLSNPQKGKKKETMKVDQTRTMTQQYFTLIKMGKQGKEEREMDSRPKRENNTLAVLYLLS